jgi:uncharacterized membrane protein YbhN (UPF0104 family)
MAGQSQKPETSSARRIVNIVVTTVLILGAVVLMHRALRDIEWVRLRDDLVGLPLTQVLHAGLWAALSYGALTFYDYFGMRYLRRGASYGQVALSALLAYAISHTLGFPAVTGGAVRYRFYARWGMNALDVARVMALAGVALLTGLFVVGGTALAWNGAQRGLWGAVPAGVMHGFGVVLLAIVLGYVALGFFRDRLPPRLFGIALPLPRPHLAIGQVLAGTVDWLSVASVLYVLLPAGTMPFTEFAGIFVSAYMLGTISNVPGGLGVFDSLMLVSLGPSISPEIVLSSLLVYRAIYYLIPFAIGGAVFVGLEILPHHRWPRLAGLLK